MGSRKQEVWAGQRYATGTHPIFEFFKIHSLLRAARTIRMMSNNMHIKNTGVQKLGVIMQLLLLFLLDTTYLKRKEDISISLHYFSMQKIFLQRGITEASTNKLPIVYTKKGRLSGVFTTGQFIYSNKTLLQI